MQGEEHIKAALNGLKSAARAGYAIALHVHFTTPKFLFQAYPADWTTYYTTNGLVMQDPTVRWGFENTGRIHWSELVPLDHAGVLARAAAHGMAYGFTIAADIAGSRSIASFARSDREFKGAEMDAIEAVLADLHRDTSQIERLAPETCEALRKMSVEVTHPRSSEAAAR
jgi:LuxR family transcriptional regulator